MAKRIFLSCILLIITNVTWAEDYAIFAKSEFDRAVNLAGVSYTNIENNLDIVIELNKALIAIPAMQRAGVVNRNLNEKDIRLLPVTLSVTLVGMFYTGGILQHIYSENATANNLHVNAYVLAANEYGVMTKQSCYEFDFNREIYSKISWDNFVPVSLMGISQHFDFSTWCKAVFARETGANV